MYPTCGPTPMTRDLNGPTWSPLPLSPVSWLYTYPTAPISTCLVRNCDAPQSRWNEPGSETTYLDLAGKGDIAACSHGVVILHCRDGPSGLHRRGRQASVKTRKPKADATFIGKGIGARRSAYSAPG
jgi:hypothetical protein